MRKKERLSVTDLSSELYNISEELLISKEKIWFNSEQKRELHHLYLRLDALNDRVLSSIITK